MFQQIREDLWITPILWVNRISAESSITVTDPKGATNAANQTYRVCFQNYRFEQLVPG